MNSIVETTIAQIGELNPIQGKKLRKSLPLTDEKYLARANSFLNKYVRFLDSIGKDLAYGIDCYLRMCADVMHETIKFMATGEYSSKSFEDTNKRVYSNPEVMEYYMHALIMSEFLWAHHYKMFTYFVESLPKYKQRVKNYLEIGAGHGLFVSEAVATLNDDVRFEVVDISPSSLEMARRFVENSKVNYMLMDVFVYEPKVKYDFITMGEVLEHVEEPVKLLTKVKDLLAADGHAFITTPTNAPAIDHLYLFRNAKDIRDVIHAADLEIVDEYSCYAENVTEKMAVDMKITLMYAAILRRRTNS